MDYRLYIQYTENRQQTTNNQLSLVFVDSEKTEWTDPNIKAMGTEKGFVTNF